MQQTGSAQRRSRDGWLGIRRSPGAGTAEGEAWLAPESFFICWMCRLFASSAPRAGREVLGGELQTTRQVGPRDSAMSALDATRFDASIAQACANSRRFDAGNLLSRHGSNKLRPEIPENS